MYTPLHQYYSDYHPMGKTFTQRETMFYTTTSILQRLPPNGKDVHIKRDDVLHHYINTTATTTQWGSSHKERRCHTKRDDVLHYYINTTATTTQWGRRSHKERRCSTPLHQFYSHYHKMGKTFTQRETMLYTTTSILQRLPPNGEDVHTKRDDVLHHYTTTSMLQPLPQNGKDVHTKRDDVLHHYINTTATTTQWERRSHKERRGLMSVECMDVYSPFDAL